MTDEFFAHRKGLSFAQAEGAAQLPRQLTLGEVSQELRAKLWAVVDASLLSHQRDHDWASDQSGSYFIDPWTTVLYRKHVMRDHRMSDEFVNNTVPLRAQLKAVFQKGDYVAIFDLLQWLLEQPERPINASTISWVLEESRAAYRLLDDESTVVPITSEHDRETINRAFADLGENEFAGARSHLSAAAQLLTAGDSAASIRESIHAVESVARLLGGTNSLNGALQKLKSMGHLHPALERGFSALYGFTSDEKGIRHALINTDAANVDETDAIFMIGACSAFVSYLINRARDDVGIVPTEGA